MGKTWNGRKLSHKGGKVYPPSKRDIGKGGDARATPKELWLIQQEKLELIGRSTSLLQIQKEAKGGVVR